MRTYYLCNAAIAAAVVCMVGCGKQVKQSAPVVRQEPDLGAAFRKVLAEQAAKNPILPDEDLILRFKKQREIFEKLRGMIVADPHLFRVDEDWTNPSNPEDAGVPMSRIAEYRRLLTEVGCRRGLGFLPGSPGIYFFSSLQGTVVGGQGQGYYFSESIPDPLTADTATYRPPKTKSTYRVYRPIDEHWYIYYELD